MKGYDNSLYFPHHTSVSDGDIECNAYWLASPAAQEGIYAVPFTTAISITGESWYVANLALRPVVSLNSGTKVNAIEAE